MSPTQLLVPTLTQMLRAQSAWLDKAVSHRQAAGDAPDAVLALKLAPDMYPLAAQVRFSCFQAMEPVYRLRGEPLPAALLALREAGWHADAQPGTLSDAQGILSGTIAFLGELAPDALDGGAALPIALELPNGIAFDMTRWAQLAGAQDPYAEASAQQVEAMGRDEDLALIEAASGANAIVHDITGNSGANAKLNYDNVVDGKMKWGDEQEDIALMAVHSKTFSNLLKLKDTGGRPLVTDVVGTTLQKFVNIPLIVSDRLAVDMTPDPEDPSTWIYDSLILKKNALVYWYAGQPQTKVQIDALKDSEVAATNWYWVAYCYKNMPGKTKSGAIKIRHKN